jgi:hypothetical protein
MAAQADSETGGATTAAFRMAFNEAHMGRRTTGLDARG